MVIMISDEVKRIEKTIKDLENSILYLKDIEIELRAKKKKKVERSNIDDILNRIEDTKKEMLKNGDKVPLRGTRRKALGKMFSTVILENFEGLENEVTK